MSVDDTPDIVKNKNLNTVWVLSSWIQSVGQVGRAGLSIARVASILANVFVCSYYHYSGVTKYEAVV